MSCSLQCEYTEPDTEKKTFWLKTTNNSKFYAFKRLFISSNRENLEENTFILMNNYK